MHGVRFSMLGVLIAMLVIAAALGALRANSEIVAALAATLFAGLLCLSVVGAIVGRDDRRVMCLGFAVFGWAYASIVYFSTPGPTYTANRTAVRSALPTDRMLAWFANLQTSYSVGSRVMAQWRGGGWYSAVIVEYDPQASLYSVRWDDGSALEWVSLQQMQLISVAGVQGGHAILGPLVAAIGAIVSRWCFGNRPAVPAAAAARKVQPD